MPAKTPSGITGPWRLCWVRAASAAGKTLEIVHVPESLQALLRLAGLEDLLLT
ncbi:MAG: hypothetical protein KDI01_03925 [Halioglobus sp.]|nr:hypothetical protein [Halioglobus sp.]